MFTDQESSCVWNFDGHERQTGGEIRKPKSSEPWPLFVSKLIYILLYKIQANLLIGALNKIKTYLIERSVCVNVAVYAILRWYYGSIF